MIRQILAAFGLGLAGYVLFNAWQESRGITTGGEGGLLDASMGEIQGGFYKVSSVWDTGQNMNISITGLAHIKGWEKFRPVAYLDQGGKPTIGYGHLIKPLESFGRLTETEATGLLLQDLGVAMDAVNRGVKVPISQAQFDGLVSFAFNVGAGAFLRSTLLKLLNRGDIAGVERQFMQWVYVGKTKSDGLINRRLADLKLFRGLA